MKLAVFDIDGTLAQSFPFDDYYYEAVAARLGVPAHVRGTRVWQNATDEGVVHELFEAHGRQASDEDIAWIKRRYAQLIDQHFCPLPAVPGANELLRHVRNSKEWDVAIATGNWLFAATRKLDAAGIDHRDVAIAGSDGRSRRTQIMREALRLLSINESALEQVVYIGDTPYDVRATRELGWRFVGVASDRYNLGEHGAVDVLRDFLPIEAAVETLTNASVPRAVG